MGQYILIDGYNVIKNNLMYKMVESKSMAEARYVLITQLKNRYRQTSYKLTVVFDGNDKLEQMRHEDHICIIFSRFGETADKVIARLAGEARTQGHHVTLYSDDVEVQDSVEVTGGTIQTTYRLTTRLNAAPHDLEARVQHRQAIRRLYGFDPSYKPDDEEEPHHQAYKKKKKSKHHK